MKARTTRDPKYRAWLRTLACTFCHRYPPSEVSHHGRHGMGLKASDHEALPACADCHRRWHNTGSPCVEWDTLSRDEKRERFAEEAARLRMTHEETW